MCNNFYPNNLALGARGCCNSGINPLAENLAINNPFIEENAYWANNDANSCRCYNRGFEQGYRMGIYDRRGNGCGF